MCIRDRYYINKNDEEKSIAEAKKEVEFNPGNADGHYVFGEVYLKAGDSRANDAVKSFEKACAIDKNHVEALMSLGSLKYRQGYLEQAQDMFSRVLKLVNNKYPEVYRNLGNVYSDMGQSSLAIGHYESYLKLNPAASDRAAVEAKIQLLK